MNAEAYKAKGLKEARQLFNEIHLTCRILVAKHPIEDHPEREFTVEELIQLVRDGNWVGENNRINMPIPGSWLLKVKDRKNRKCEIAFLFEKLSSNEISIIIGVKHAYRNMGEKK